MGNLCEACASKESPGIVDRFVNLSSNVSMERFEGKVVPERVEARDEGVEFSKIVSFVDVERVDQSESSFLDWSEDDLFACSNRGAVPDVFDE